MTERRDLPEPSAEPSGRNLPVPRPERAAPLERFSSPPNARRFGLSAERGAQIVRQSGSARSVAFLSLLLIVVFLAAYYFYDAGVPGVYAGREASAAQQLQVTQVANGYALFEANCARCHGAAGQGYIGPALNDQTKLLAHLNPQYIRNVLTVGGRYVCGDANSVMPVWADTNGGPLNYQQIDDIISFITAPNTITFQGTDPTTGQTVTMHGWRDPSYALPAHATPFPDCWRATPAPGASASGAGPSNGGAGAQPSASGTNIPGASGAAPGGSGALTPTKLSLAAQNIKFDQSSLQAPANQAFTIAFDNKDSGVAHNVTIYQGTNTSGTPVFAGTTFPGPATQNYQVPALAPGTYTFVCTVHPTLMTGTLTVK